MSRGNKSIIHAIKKKQTRNADASKLDELQLHFNNQRIPVQREVIIQNSKFNTPNKLHESDFILDKQIHLQHDTYKTHGDLKNPDAKTKKRNADYLRAGLPLIIINQDSAKLHNLDECDLASYRYEEEVGKLVSVREEDMRMEFNARV